MPFLTDLYAKCNTDNSWVLDEPLKYECITSGFRGVVIEVPRGFITDFASVPRIPVVYWLLGDTAHKAAVIHDLCYRRPDITKTSRKEADMIFRDAMKESGVALWRAEAMYQGLRCFGGANYHGELYGRPAGANQRLENNSNGGGGCDSRPLP